MKVCISKKNNLNKCLVDNNKHRREIMYGMSSKRLSITISCVENSTDTGNILMVPRAIVGEHSCLLTSDVHGVHPFSVCHLVRPVSDFREEISLRI